MEFKTKKIGDNTHVVKNNVVSAAFVRPGKSGEWVILVPRIAHTTSTLYAALRLIAAGMSHWYTVAQATVRLVELGKTTKAPAAQTMYRWLQAKKFPGAIRCGVGRNRGWRIPETALRKFKRKGGEK